MDLMVGDNGTAQVSVQKEHDSTVKLRVIPQLQKSGGFGIVFQMAGVRKMRERCSSFMPVLFMMFP